MRASVKTRRFPYQPAGVEPDLGVGREPIEQLDRHRGPALVQQGRCEVERPLRILDDAVSRFLVVGNGGCECMAFERNLPQIQVRHFIVW